MKKSPLLLCMAFVCLFIACDKDDNANDPEQPINAQAALTGSWNLIGYAVEEGKSITEIDDYRISQDYTSYGKDYDMVVTFDDETQTVDSNGVYTLVINYDFAGQQYTQESKAYAALERSQWRLEGENLILTTDEREATASILEATDTKLVVLVDLELFEEVGGGKVTSTGKLTLTLER